MSKPKAPAAAVPGRQPPLPSKEAGLYRDILRMYDERQWRKCIKTADLILKKVPNHGETLAMKGLCVFNSGRKAEGLELAKEGVKQDIK
jgi:hypothetical protein